MIIVLLMALMLLTPFVLGRYGQGITFYWIAAIISLGRDRNLPDFFSYVSTRTHTPAGALLWTVMLISLMVFEFQYTTMVERKLAYNDSLTGLPRRR